MDTGGALFGAAPRPGHLAVSRIGGWAARKLSRRFCVWTRSRRLAVPDALALHPLPASGRIGSLPASRGGG